jgi:DNA-binding transcriptional MerR regulator
MKFAHSTPAQNLAELRRRFRASSGVETLRMAAWLHANLTVAQIKDVFNLSDAQVTALRSRMVALRDQLRSLEQAKGE